MVSGRGSLKGYCIKPNPALSPVTVRSAMPLRLSASLGLAALGIYTPSAPKRGVGLGSLLSSRSRIRNCVSASYCSGLGGGCLSPHSGHRCSDFACSRLCQRWRQAPVAQNLWLALRGANDSPHSSHDLRSATVFLASETFLITICGLSEAA